MAVNCCDMTVKYYGNWSTGKAQALPANIRLGWKGLPATNTPAYYENL